MRLATALLIMSVLGVLGGAALIGLAALGGAIIFESLAAGVWALLKDDGRGQPQVHAVPVPSVSQILERARAS